MKRLIILLSCLVMSLSSQATLLTIELNQNSYEVGEVLTADFIISDIEEDASAFQKLLASFDFSVSWDNALIEYSSFSFGNNLDLDPLNPSDQFFDVMADSLGFTEISYALTADLFSAQDGLSHFVLASVNFNVTGAGAGSLALNNVAFGDDFGVDFTEVSSADKAFSATSGNPIDVP